MAIIMNAIDLLLVILEILIVVRAVISWLPIRRDNQLIDLLYKLTEPLLSPVRSLIEKSALGKNMLFDLSPIIVILIIGFLRLVLKRYF